MSCLNEDIIEDSNQEQQDEYNDIVDNTKTDIDELTLSLLMNKTHYKKYVLQLDGVEDKMEQQRVLDTRKYRSKILDLTAHMIDSPDLEISHDMNKIFVAYTTKLIHYFKMKEIEKQNRYNFSNKADEENVLFGSVDTENKESLTESFWSKEKVVKTGSNISIPNCDMRMFSNR
tara:strand:- start:3167 stop:3688 length:522 start_codon:yes stop_codon:yes gene_type:complete